MYSNYISYGLSILGIIVSLVIFFVQWRKKKLVNYEIIHTPVFDGDITPDEIDITLKGERIEGQLFYCKGAVINLSHSDISKSDLLGAGKFEIVCPGDTKWIQKKIVDHYGALNPIGQDHDKSMFLDFDLLKSKESVVYEGYYYLPSKFGASKYSDSILPLHFEFRIKNIPTVLKTISKEKLIEYDLKVPFFSIFMVFLLIIIMMPSEVNQESIENEVEVYLSEDSKYEIEDVQNINDTTVSIIFSDEKIKNMEMGLDQFNSKCFNMKLKQYKIEEEEENLIGTFLLHFILWLFVVVGIVSIGDYILKRRILFTVNSTDEEIV